MYDSLGALKKLQNIISFDIPACLSAHMNFGSHWTEFHEIKYSRIIKSVATCQVSLKSANNNGKFVKIFPIMRNVSGKICGENTTSIFIQ